MNREVVYLYDVHSPRGAAAREAVRVVCVGDSLTGWNNFGHVSSWPFPTYPHFLQEMCTPLGLTLADGGIAGEVSSHGLRHVQRYLELLPNSRYFIIGFGTNDLGATIDSRRESNRIIANLGAMIAAVRKASKVPILFNVPNVNEAMFPTPLARELREHRVYHNDRLAKYCAEHRVPLADVCSCLDDEHFGDEVHPNSAGAKRIAECVFEVLHAVWESSEKGL